MLLLLLLLLSKRKNKMCFVFAVSFLMLLPCFVGGFYASLVYYVQRELETKQNDNDSPGFSSETF